MAEDYVDFLVEKLYSPAAICQKLRMAYVSDADEVYIMHEGRDDKYFYSALLKRITKKNTNLTFFCCGNRDGVVKAFKYICPMRQFNPKRILYMVDRDYDEVLPAREPLPRQVFVTDYYSIESYFIARPCLEGILRHVIGIPNENGVVESSIEQNRANNN